MEGLMAAPASPADPRDLISLLHKECHPQQGYRIHDHLLKLGFSHRPLVETLILNMYGRCGDLAAAEAVFQKAAAKDSCALWNSMISIYAKHGRCEEAFELYLQMRAEGVTPTQVTFQCVSQACNGPEFLEKCQSIHDDVVGFGYEGEAALGCALVSMYGRCGSVEFACIMFEKACKQDVVSWTALITVCAMQGYSECAFEAFQRMQEQGIAPNSVTFIGILSGNVCIGIGLVLHASIVKCGFDSEDANADIGTGLRLATSLVNMYGKCGYLDDARFVFDNLPDKNVTTWNAMIDAYAQNHRGSQGLLLFRKLCASNVDPDASTFVSSLVACLSSDDAEREGEFIHACIKGTMYESNVMVATALMNMYCKFGNMEKARLVFDHIHWRTVVTWNTLICGYVCEREGGRKVLELIRCMLEQGIMPDNITYVGIFGGCEISQDIEEALRFHAGFSSIRVVLEADVAVRIALVNLYGKCGRLAEARALFDMIPKHNPVSWNAMISVYAQQGEFEESLSLFMSLLQGSPVFDEALLITALGVCANSPFHVHGRLIHGLVVKLGYDVSTEVGTAIIDMYGKFGNLEEARSCFLRLNVHNVMEWNALIGAYIRNGCYTEAIELFRTMQEDHVRLDTVTFVTILGAFSGSLEPAGSRLTALHGIIVGHGFEPTVDTGTALISMYGKNGNLERACIMFAKLPTRCLISWNSMMTAFAQHGLGQEVFHLFIQMLGEGLQPDGVTMLVVLSACSHMGLIKESQRFFTSMLCHYESEPKLEHFGCLVDLYGRLGKVDEAKTLIYGLHLEDHVFFWQILLGACKLHNNMEVGKHAMRNAVELDSGTTHTCSWWVTQ